MASGIFPFGGPCFNHFTVLDTAVTFLFNYVVIVSENKWFWLDIFDYA